MRRGRDVFPRIRAARNQYSRTLPAGTPFGIQKREEWLNAAKVFRKEVIFSGSCSQSFDRWKHLVPALQQAHMGPTLLDLVPAGRQGWSGVGLT